MLTSDNTLKLKLKKGHPVIGTWSIISSPVVVEILALSGFDFLILDMEHGIYDITSLDSCIRACEVAGCSPIVRVPGMCPSAIQSSLDLGAHGIIVPQIDGYDSASKSISMMKFYPDGNRGYNPFTRAGFYEGGNSNQQGKFKNDFNLSSVIIESKSALDEIDLILNIKDLDIVYIGIYDLAVALGYQGDVKDQILSDILNTLIAKINNAGKAAGIMVRGKEDIINAIHRGVKFLVYSVDTSLLISAGKEAVASFKNATSTF